MRRKKYSRSVSLKGMEVRLASTNMSVKIGAAVSGNYPNEPSGFEVIAAHDFTAFPSGTNGEAGTWYTTNNPDPDGSLTIVSGLTPPFGNSSGIELTYPTGILPGSSPAYFGGWKYESGSRVQFDEFYESCLIRIPTSDFEFTGAPGWKMLGYWGAGRDPADGSDTEIYNIVSNTDAIVTGTNLRSEMPLRVYQQSVISRSIAPNTGTAAQQRFVCNQWNQIEHYMKLNTPTSSANGLLKVWLNGVLILNYTDLQWRTDTSPYGFYGRRFASIYGGGGTDLKTRSDSFQVAHLYMSGARL